MEKQSAPKDALQSTQCKSNRPRRPSKLERLLVTLLSYGSAGLRGLECSNANGIHTAFFGENIRFWSSCLNSDVSTLQNTYGIEIGRVFDPYNSPEGHTANFKRYWLADRGSAVKAVMLLNTCRKKRGLKSLSVSQVKAVMKDFES